MDLSEIKKFEAMRNDKMILTPPKDWKVLVNIENQGDALLLPDQWVEAEWLINPLIQNAIDRGMPVRILIQDRFPYISLKIDREKGFDSVEGLIDSLRTGKVVIENQRPNESYRVTVKKGDADPEILLSKTATELYHPHISEVRQYCLERLSHRHWPQVMKPYPPKAEI